MFAPSLKEIFAIAAKLPAAPRVLAEVAQLLEDVNVDVDAVAGVLRRDGPLTAAVLRISNSAYYGSGGVGSIEAAVSRIGFAEVHRMIGWAASGVLADRVLPFYGIETAVVRQNMIANAIAAESLAAIARCNPRHLYTAGLLRPIGMMVLDRMARNFGDPLDKFDILRDGNYATWESRVMQIRNAAVTAVVLSEWRFAQDVVDSVRGHGLTPGAKDPTRGAAVLHLACWVTTQIGLGLPGEHDAWEISPEKLALAGLVEDDVMGRIRLVEEQVQELQSALNY
jgi:HD-like signal output (HDOD) protein